METIKQNFISDAEGETAEHKAQLMRAKEMLLLQKEEFARKDAELEAERILRTFQEKIVDEKERLQTLHQMQMQQTKFTTDNKIKLETARSEM